MDLLPTSCLKLLLIATKTLKLYQPSSLQCLFPTLKVSATPITPAYSLPPTLAPGATPTPQTLLLAAAATSPAHLVPCLTERSHEDTIRKLNKLTMAILFRERIQISARMSC